MSRRAIPKFFEQTPQIQRIREKAFYHSDQIIQRQFRIPEEETGRLRDFKFRWTQQRIYDIYKEELHSNKPVRLWLLKFRRVGATSLFAADEVVDAWSQPNRRIGIVAHNEHRAKEILQTCKDYMKNIRDERFRAPLSRDAIQGLKFADNSSEVIIGTCKEPAKVRGGGLHRSHLSEAAWYGRMFKIVLQEVATTIAPVAGTVSIIETTGRSRGSSAHEHWVASREGETIWRAEFFAWQDDPTAVLAFDSALQRDTILGEMAAVEPRLAEKFRFYKLTPEQMHWAYRYCYLYRCEQDYEYFCREFPMSEEEAWDSSGISFFGDNEIAAMQRRLKDPILFSFGGRFINQIFRNFTELQKINRYDESGGGLVLKLWKVPVPGRTYVIGSDCSLGEQGGAYSAGYVIDVESREMMAAYRGRIRPDEHAYVMASLGTIYNTAILAPEVNPGGGGMQVLNDLQRLGYTRIYIWRLRDDKRGIVLSQKLGWITNSMTRPLMLNELRKMFVDSAHERFPDPGMFRDKTLLNEMLTFQKDYDTGRIEAAENAYDDCIMGLAVAHRVAADEVHGGMLDIYGTYGKQKIVTPFGELLQHYEQIQDGRDPTDVLSMLFDSNFDITQGGFRWHDD